MKTELITSAIQRETKCHEKRKKKRRSRLIFQVSSVILTVLICWFRLYTFASGCETLLGTHLKMGDAHIG